jgi:hypothetical protein
MITSSSIIDRHHASFTRTSSVINEVLIGTVITINTSDQIGNTFHSLYHIVPHRQYHTVSRLFSTDSGGVYVLSRVLNSRPHEDTSNEVIINMDDVVVIPDGNTIFLTFGDDIVLNGDISTVGQVDTHTTRLMERTSSDFTGRVPRRHIGILEVKGR